MDIHRKEFAEKLYHLHTSGGGSLNWHEVGAHAGITWQSARAKVRWWLRKHPQFTIDVDKLYQTYTPDDQRLDSFQPRNYRTPPDMPPTPTELESRVRYIETMLENLIGKQETEDAESEDNPF